MKSCIYEGSILHRRAEPLRHEFRYRIFMMYVDLDELPRLFRGRWLWSAEHAAPARFRRSDYPGDASEPLDVSIRDLVARRTGMRPSGPIRLLTHFRYFGYGFNPVSFFYCFAPDGETIEAVVAHVTNTPWGETHSYVLRPSQSDGTGRWSARAAKVLHVSPFMPMDAEHEFRLDPPGQRLFVGIADRCEGRETFRADLVGRRREITGASLARVLIVYPLLTLRVLAAIYWQAFRLYRKKAPYYAHPGMQPAIRKEVRP